MHFLNRIGAIILFVCVAGVSHVATLYVTCGAVPAASFWMLYSAMVVIGVLMWLKDWNCYSFLKFKWYDK